MNCDRVQADLARAVSAGTGLSADLDSVLEHAGDCEACRRILEAGIEANPDLIFALGAALPPAPDWRGFNARVLAGIEADARRGWRARVADRLLGRDRILGGDRLVRPGSMLAAAAAILLAVVLMLPGEPKAPPAGTANVAEVGRAGEAVDAAFDPGPAPVEAVASPTAHIVQMQLDHSGRPGGSAGGAGDFVLIVDEEIGL